MQHVGCGSNGVGAEEQLQAGLFGSGNESVSCSLVSGDVHVSARHGGFAFNLICMGYGSMGVVSVVVSCMNDFDVGFGHFGLFGEFLADEVLGNLQVAVEEPAYEAHGEHVAAFQYRLVVHAGVGQAVFYHLRDGGGDDILLDAHFFDRVIGLEGGFFQVGLLESIGINNDTGSRFSKLVLGFQCGGVHGYQYVAFISRGIDFVRSDMHLESGYAGQRTLRGSDVCRIVGESADVVSHRSRNCRKDVAGELHTVAGVSGEADYHLLQFFDHHVVCHNLRFT